MPPGAAVQTVHEVVTELVATGDVSSYGADKRLDLRQRFADKAGVDVSDVGIEVTSASVRIRVSIRTADASAAAATASLLDASLASATAASAFAGVAVTAAPIRSTATLQVVVQAPASPPPPPPPFPQPPRPTSPLTESDSSKLSAGESFTGIIAGVAAGLVAIILAVALWICNAKEQQADRKALTTATPVRAGQGLQTSPSGRVTLTSTLGRSGRLAVASPATLRA